MRPAELSTCFCGCPEGTIVPKYGCLFPADVKDVKQNSKDDQLWHRHATPPKLSSPGSEAYPEGSDMSCWWRMCAGTCSMFTVSYLKSNAHSFM